MKLPNQDPVEIFATMRVQVADVTNGYCGLCGSVRFFDTKSGMVGVQLDHQLPGYTTQFAIAELVALLPFRLKLPR